MPPTTLSPTQLRPIDSAIVRKHEKIFLQYATICLVFLTILVWSMHNYPIVWKNNRLWGWGSYLTFISVIYSRFLHVKNRLSVTNQRIDENSRRQMVRYLEKVFDYLWIAGFLLLVVSRWFIY